jgi:hypothetical protein
MLDGQADLKIVAGLNGTRDGAVRASGRIFHRACLDGDLGAVGSLYVGLRKLIAAYDGLNDRKVRKIGSARFRYKSGCKQKTRSQGKNETKETY